MKKYEIELDGQEITFETKGWARRTNGEVLVRAGETEVLVTVVMSEEDTDRDYFPLMVFYEERFYARGAILGSRFVRREGRPSNNATLISRAIDRTIRPLFPDGLKKEVEVIITCLSWDGVHDPDVLGFLGASFALHVSDIPWAGPVGALRLNRTENGLKVNPSYEEREDERPEILLCGVQEEEDVLINMIEMDASAVAEEFVLRAYDRAVQPISELIELQERAREEMGKEKAEFEVEEDVDIEKKVKELARERLEDILFEGDENNMERNRALGRLKREVLAEFEEEDTELADRYFEKTVKNTVQSKALAGRRIGGRAHHLV